MDGEWFDSQTRAFAQTAPRGGLFLLWLHLACLGPVLVLLRILRIEPGPPLASEAACYQAGGYVVEFEKKPVVDYCCFCRDAAGAFCPDAAPKAVYDAGDKAGKAKVKDVTCLRARDTAAPDCTATCKKMPPRKNAPTQFLS